MSKQPKFISDPFDFARRGTRLEGEVDVRELGRFSELLREGLATESVSFAVSGRSHGEKSFLDIRAKGEVSLTCQRCLEAVVCPIAVEACLLLIEPDQALPDEALEDDSFDPVHAGRDFDLLFAIEDELLLALPLAPVHMQCHMPGEEGVSGRPSPFAALAALKRKA